MHVVTRTFAPKQTALRITLVYALAAGLWILTSDQILVALVTDASLLGSLQTVKGWAFVAVTSGLFYLTLRRELQQRAEVEDRLEQRVAERTRELAEANERLTELDRLKSKFVSDVSHELRTPVANLKLHLQLLERGRPEMRDQYSRVLNQQADRLAQLIDDILNLSRLELGRNRITLGWVSLNHLVNQVVDSHRPGAEMAGLTLTFIPNEDELLTLGDVNQLAQVVTNLVVNAIHYTAAGRVTVRVGRVAEDDRAFVLVEDTGVGIDAEDMPHLFERFYRGRRAAHSDITGTGLGLAIVKEIVDAHGGAIDVDSHVGRGSAFRVWLPLRGAHAPQEPSYSVSPSP
jgi:signal transduction histidine kinase